MSLYSDTGNIFIATPPPRAPVVDRPAAAAAAKSALVLADRVCAHGRATPAVERIASGVESGLRDRAQSVITALEAGAIDDVFPTLLARLAEAETAARDVLARTSYADHDRRAIQSPADTVRPPINYEPL